MKIPTSTSFVMAATASLALQSSARAIPPESPDLGHAPPHSGQPEPSARFPDHMGPGSENHTASPSQGLKLRETDATDSASTDSLSALLNDVSYSLNGLGLKTRTHDKGAENSAADSSAPALSARQVPVPISPGAPPAANPVTNESAQVANGNLPQAPASPSTVTGVVGGAAPQGVPQPAQAPQDAPQGASIQPPVSAPLPNDAPLVAPVNSVPGPGVVRRDGDALTPGAIPQTAGAAGGQVVGTAGGIPGQVIGSTPAASIVGNAPVNPAAIIQGAMDGAADTLNGVGNAAGAVMNGLTGAAPVNQVNGATGQVLGGTPVGGVYNALQGRGDPNGDNDNEDENSPPSPSSTIAAPSSSPSNSPAIAPSMDSTDGSVTTTMDPSSTPTPDLDMDKAAESLPVTPPIKPLNSTPVPEPNIVSNSPNGAPEATPPVSTLPVPVPTPISVPDSLPVGTPSGAPAAPPAQAPVNPVNPSVPKKRTLAMRDEPSTSDDAAYDVLPEGFAAPTGPIPNDTPPLLAQRSIAKEDVGPDASASVDHPGPPMRTAHHGTSMIPVSRSTRTATSWMATSWTATSSTATATSSMASQPSRRRFFRFNREEKA